ncbi:MAG: hypothetical protein PHQ23_09805 [Candidatus Wallbacteria bacterium]|nr:hypothetical protein [Candidatus Wallbacteria bacterium]
MKYRSVLCLCLCLVLVAPVFCEMTGEQPGSPYPLASKVVELAQKFWTVHNQLWSGEISEDEYNHQIEAVYAEARALVKEIVDAYNAGDKTMMADFSRFYGSPDIQKHPDLKNAINQLMVDELVEFLKNKDLTSDTYFPGYGYADVGFVYKKVEEVKQEVLNTFWRKIEKEHQKNEKYRTYLEVGVNMGAGFEVKFLTSPFQMKIDGVFKYVREVEITVMENIKTVETVKFQNMKVWFNLYRAKAGFFGGASGSWELVGQTYELREEPTGLPVTEKPDKADQIYYPGYGYGEIGYTYQKGAELSSEALSVYWKKVSKHLINGTTTRVLLEVGAEAGFNGGLSLVPTGSPFQLNIGGKIAWVREYTITAMEDITIDETVKFQRTKVWFELKRKASGSDWELCGKTYDVHDEESGLPVVEIPGQLS